MSATIAVKEKIVASIGLPNSTVLDNIREKYDVFSRPDRDDEFILDLQLFEHDVITELLEILGIERDSEGADILDVAHYVSFYLA